MVMASDTSLNKEVASSTSYITAKGDSGAEIKEEM